MLTDRGVKTYSNRAALNMLAELAETVPAGLAVVEVGVFRGGSLRVLAESTRSPVYGVDTWGLAGAYAGDSSEGGDKYGLGNLTVAARTVSHCRNAVLVHDFSVHAALVYSGPPVGLLYIDGEHSYEAVCDDYRAWRTHLVAGAWVAFDDYDRAHPQVVTAVDHLVQTYSLQPVKVFGGRLATTRFLTS